MGRIIEGGGSMGHKIEKGLTCPTVPSMGLFQDYFQLPLFFSSHFGGQCSGMGGTALQQPRQSIMSANNQTVYDLNELANLASKVGMRIFENGPLPLI